MSTDSHLTPWNLEQTPQGCWSWHLDFHREKVATWMIAMHHFDSLFQIPRKQDSRSRNVSSATWTVQKKTRRTLETSCQLRFAGCCDPLVHAIHPLRSLGLPIPAVHLEHFKTMEIRIDHHDDGITNTY